MKIDLFEIGVNIAMYPVNKMENNQHKWVRVLSLLFLYTIWLPFLFFGLFILVLSIFQELYKQI